MRIAGPQGFQCRRCGANAKPWLSSYGRLGVGYTGIESLGYTHVITNMSAAGDLAHVVMPRAHLVASLLDRWWLGTRQGATRPAHLDYYLDEFTFRFNRRISRAHGLFFYCLMQNAVTSDPVPYRALVGGKPQDAHKI